MPKMPQINNKKNAVVAGLTTAAIATLLHQPQALWFGLAATTAVLAYKPVVKGYKWAMDPENFPRRWFSKISPANDDQNALLGAAIGLAVSTAIDTAPAPLARGAKPLHSLLMDPTVRRAAVATVSTAVGGATGYFLSNKRIAKALTGAAHTVDTSTSAPAASSSSTPGVAAAASTLAGAVAHALTPTPPNSKKGPKAS